MTDISDRSRTRHRRWPLGVALAAKVLLLVWLGWHGFPRYTSDALAFKQPAQTYLQSGRYALPTYAGYLPNSDTLFAAYPPGYVYANAVVMHLWGANIHASLGLDLAVHFVVSAILLTAVWALGGGAVGVSLALLLSNGLLVPAGRPEELAILFAVVALALSFRGGRAHLGVAVLLGLAGATHPLIGLKSWIVLTAIERMRMGRDRRVWLHSLVYAATSGAIALGIWALYVAPNVREAIEQLRAAGRVAYFATPRDLLHQWSWSITAVLLILLVPLAAVSGSIRGTIHDPRASVLVSAVGVTTPAVVFLNMVLGRPYYDWRLLGWLLALVATVVLGPVISRLWKRLPVYAVVAAVPVAVLALLPSVDVARFALAPLAWGSDAVTYDDARRIVAEQAPSPLSVGGEGAMWGVAGDERPFLGLRWVSEEHWPDVLVSSTWAHAPFVEQESSWSAKVMREYREVDVGWDKLGGGCGLHIGPILIPIARGTCDWHVRLWKRTMATAASESNDSVVSAR